MKGRTIFPLALAATAALFFSTQKVNANPLEIGLFPPQPIYRSIMADPDITKTQFEMPFSGNFQSLENQLLTSPLNNLGQFGTLGVQMPLIQLGIQNNPANSTLPRVSLDRKKDAKKISSDESLSATLVASGQISAPYINRGLKYDTNLELFLTSPIVNDLYSSNSNGTSNPLYLVAGFSQKGILNLNNIGNKTLQEIFAESPTSLGERSFFGDVYIVGKSPYSDQFTIVRGGVDNILSSSGGKSNWHLSVMMELPSILPFIKSANPYISGYVQMPFGSKDAKEAIGQVGLKIGEKDSRAIIAFLQAQYSNSKWDYSAGVKIQTN